jgi:hypothetical protein
LRRILRFLWQEHGAPKLDDYVPRHPAARPRSVVATDEEVENLLAHAKPSLKLWLLLCSDLALRSGTAAQARPAHYDAARRRLADVLDRRDLL